jgi:hypothetical protein
LSSAERLDGLLAEIFRAGLSGYKFGRLNKREVTKTNAMVR